MAPVQRPMAHPQRPMQQRPLAQAGYGRPMTGQQQPQNEEREQPVRKQKAAKKKGGGAWRVVLQFVVGLAVIAVVAFAIVWLYIRYYQ